MEPNSRPAVLYNLELTEKELTGLWALLVLLNNGGAKFGTASGKDKRSWLDGPERRVLRKLQRLMEGQ